MNKEIENNMVTPYADDDPIEEPQEPEYDKERDSDILVDFISNIDKLFSMNKKQAE